MARSPENGCADQPPGRDLKKYLSKRKSLKTTTCCGWSMLAPQDIGVEKKISTWEFSGFRSCCPGFLTRSELPGQACLEKRNLKDRLFPNENRKIRTREKSDATFQDEPVIKPMPCMMRQKHFQEPLLCSSEIPKREPNEKTVPPARQP